MKFITTELEGAFIVQPERIHDSRGFFARAYCREEFEAHGLASNFAQCNISFNTMHGTLRGMHYQVAPHEEAKLVRCTMGAIYDAIIDLRRSSITFLRWIGVELSATNRCMLYVPEGFAHGFLTLANGTEVFYQVSEPYKPTSERGIRWNDPTFGILWPAEPSVISQKDTNYPDFLP